MKAGRGTAAPIVITVLPVCCHVSASMTLVGLGADATSHLVGPLQ